MTISTVNWRIVSVDPGKTFHVWNGSNRIATLRVATKGADPESWKVEFVDRPELDFGWANREVCIGYLRGIERIHVNLAHGVRFTKIKP